MPRRRSRGFSMIRKSFLSLARWIRPTGSPLALPTINVILICGCLCFAQAPTIDQSLSLKSVSSAKISPDGKYVAYQVSETNWEDNAFKTEIWGGELSTGRRFQYTNTKKSSSS